MSDCGLPAFCDPGADLVNACHHAGLTVTSGKIQNSVILVTGASSGIGLGICKRLIKNNLIIGISNNN